MKAYLRRIAVCCENLPDSIYFVWSANSKEPEIVPPWIKKWGKRGQLYNIPDQILMRVLSPNGGEVFMTLLLKCVLVVGEQAGNSAFRKRRV